MSGASACIATIEERPDAPLNLTKCGASACIATIEERPDAPLNLTKCGASACIATIEDRPDAAQPDKMRRERVSRDD